MSEASAEHRPLAPPPWRPRDGDSGVRIAALRTICTAPEGIGLTVVKVETTEPGLYGLGCASFTQRPLAVVAAVDRYLAPLLVGRDPADIEDIYRSGYVSSYWRGGPVLNYALGGVDMALWDIKGKVAGMPVHDLLGGKCREAVAVYGHASGRDVRELEDEARTLLEQGYRYVRCQIDVPGAATYGAASANSGGTWDPSAYRRQVPRAFEHLREALGDEVELLHDVHERLPPIQAIGLAKDLEPHRLFFLEDPVAPEDVEYLHLLRRQTATPIAMGELMVDTSEYVPLVRERLTDFIRFRPGALGGISVARRVAALADFFGVRTAWQGPGDVSPVGHAANVALDLSCHNFGVQESHAFSDTSREVFPGCPEPRDGYLWPNERPGIGVDVDEAVAAKFPLPDPLANDAWTRTRLRDGTIIRP